MGDDLSFAVMSDIHGDLEGFERAVRDLASSAPGLAALVINGDFLDTGRDENYRQFEACLERLRPLLPPKLVVNIGNHEFYPDYVSGPTGRAEHDAFVARYLAFSGRERVYAAEEIGGSLFISLGSESTYNTFFDDSTVRANLSQRQLTWLAALLDEGEARAMPTFVFLHQPLSGTLPWTRYYDDGLAQSSELMALLGRHPGSVLFVGHSHQTWYLPGWNFWRSPSGFAELDSSSIARPTRIDEEKGEEIDYEARSSEALVVTARPGRVEARARDFSRASWIPGGRVKLDLSPARGPELLYRR
jgi:3',5'-cyclic-AMP phosphodiesterase